MDNKVILAILPSVLQEHQEALAKEDRDRELVKRVQIIRGALISRMVKLDMIWCVASAKALALEMEDIQENLDRWKAEVVRIRGIVMRDN